MTVSISEDLEMPMLSAQVIYGCARDFSSFSQRNVRDVPGDVPDRKASDIARC